MWPSVRLFTSSAIGVAEPLVLEQNRVDRRDGAVAVPAAALDQARQLGVDRGRESPPDRLFAGRKPDLAQRPGEAGHAVEAAAAHRALLAEMLRHRGRHMARRSPAPWRVDRTWRPPRRNARGTPAAIAGPGTPAARGRARRSARARRHPPTRCLASAPKSEDLPPPGGPNTPMRCAHAQRVQAVDDPQPGLDRLRRSAGVPAEAWKRGATPRNWSPSRESRTAIDGPAEPVEDAAEHAGPAAERERVVLPQHLGPRRKPVDDAERRQHGATVP